MMFYVDFCDSSCVTDVSVLSDHNKWRRLTTIFLNSGV